MLPQDIATLSYRLERLEKEFQKFVDLLDDYALSKESTLQFSNIQDNVKRLEVQVEDIRKHTQDLSIQLMKQDTESQNRDAAIREKQDAIQIRALWFIAAAVISIITAVLISYLTHLIH